MKLNLFVAASLVLCVAFGLSVGPRPSRPNVEAIPEMVRTAAYKAYSANSNFRDGMTLQEPPAGAIPRGYRRVEYQAAEADAIRAGKELTNPFKAGDPAAAARGAFVFRTWCLPCHGPTGKGDGAVAMRGYPAPPPLNGEKTMALEDGRIFHILTFGQKNMPPYASQLSKEDRWMAVLHVRSLQQGGQGVPEEKK